VNPEPIENPQVHRVASDGLTLTVEEYGRQHRDGGAASVVFLPALGVPLSYYRRFLERWADQGRHVLGVELRGGPQSPVANLRRASFGYSHLLRADLPAVFGLDAIASAGKVVLAGHSLGGHLALLAAASGSVQPAAVVMLATGTSSPASQHTRLGRFRRWFGVRFIAATSRVLGYWPGHRLGFGGRQPKGLMTDWAYEGRHGQYRVAGDPTDYEAALAALTLPTLLISFDGDRLSPPRAVSHLANRLPGHVEHQMLSGDQVSDHFSWARRNPEFIIGEVETWLRPSGL
jgi:predicted alpha/beta hydrolase